MKNQPQTVQRIRWNGLLNRKANSMYDKKVKLKSGAVMVVWSDNVDERTMDGYPLHLLNDFDICVHTLETWTYSDIEREM